MKRLFAVLLTLCMVLSFAACSARAHKGEERPADWDLEAEILRFYNGFYPAKTSEELKPYVLSSTSERQIKNYLDQRNAAVAEMMGQGVDMINPYEYTYDSAEVTYMGEYKGYEILWVVAKSSEADQAYEELMAEQSDNTHHLQVSAVSMVAPSSILMVTIENGHYVTSLDQKLANEVLKKYEYCPVCFGTGNAVSVSEACKTCHGAGNTRQVHCEDCGETYTEEPSLNMHSVTLQPIEGFENLPTIRIEASEETDSTEQIITWQEGSINLFEGDSAIAFVNPSANCQYCESENITVTEDPCEDCEGQGFLLEEAEACSMCDGKGWIEH